MTTGVSVADVKRNRLDGEEVGVAMAFLSGLAIFLVPMIVVSIHTWLLNTAAAAPLVLSAAFVGVTIWVPVALGYWAFRRAGLNRTARGLIVGATVVLVVNAVMIGMTLLLPSFGD